MKMANWPTSNMVDPQTRKGDPQHFICNVVIRKTYHVPPSNSFTNKALCVIHANYDLKGEINKQATTNLENVEAKVMETETKRDAAFTTSHTDATEANSASADGQLMNTGLLNAYVPMPTAPKNALALVVNAPPVH
jgi:hypothetical protein